MNILIVSEMLFILLRLTDGIKGDNVRGKCRVVPVASQGCDITVPCPSRPLWAAALVVCERWSLWKIERAAVPVVRR